MSFNCATALICGNSFAWFSLMEYFPFAISFLLFCSDRLFSTAICRHWLSDKVSCAIIAEKAPRARQKHNIFFLFIFNMFLMIYNMIVFWCKGTAFLSIITIHKISQNVQNCRFF